MRRPRGYHFASFLLSILALFAWGSLVMADGGAVRLSERKGEYQITVFTAPTPMRAGPVDISVLVQKADTQAPISEVGVTVKATRRGKRGMSIIRPATIEAATNKLFHAAIFELPEAGWWDLEASISGPLGETQAHFDVEAADRLPRYRAMWPWICWPVLPIMLFSIHQLLFRRGIR
jgi:hypothetical protein